MGEGRKLLCYEDKNGTSRYVWKRSREDRAWIRFRNLREQFLPNDPQTPDRQDGRAVEEEYRTLAGLFERMEQADPAPAMSSGVSYIMQNDSHNRFRRFLADVEKVLSYKPGMPVQRAPIEEARKEADDTLRRLTETLGNFRFPPKMDFSDPNKLIEFRQGFI